MNASRRRTKVLVIVLALMSLPILLVVAEAVSFYAANRPTGAFSSSGETREYRLYVPASYDRTKPTPLVISMHGAGLWGAAQEMISQWNRVAEREGLIVVYPSGVRGAGPRIWRVERGPGLARDVRFISELIDTLAATYHIDQSRIFADGLSNGGGMAFVLSCTLADRIAAVGLVASAQTLPWQWCPDPRPVPMIAIHGTADSATPYRGGRTWVGPRSFPSITRWVTNWAQRNQCRAVPGETLVAPDVTRRAYTGCAEGAAVVLLSVQGGGHTWPGGEPPPEWFTGSTSRGIDASSELWAFYRAHPLTRE